MQKLDKIVEQWKHIRPQDDNEAMRSRLLIVPILVDLLGWQPSELLTEKLLVPELHLPVYGPHIHHRRPDIILHHELSPRYHIPAVVEAKARQKDMEALLEHRPQLKAY